MVLRVSQIIFIWLNLWLSPDWSCQTSRCVLLAHMHTHQHYKFFLGYYHKGQSETLVDSDNLEGKKTPQNWVTNQKSRNVAKPTVRMSSLLSSSQREGPRTLFFLIKLQADSQLCSPGDPETVTLR
ncbi:unnamed protein product [Rangifer tarandus platyrhynchus]|uniref:Uncharacterized protein n=1 Tax=Rangifer tarandus platyrhynchus TaxID=3082113 RepID=A0AC60A861_RANTA